MELNGERVLTATETAQRLGIALATLRAQRLRGQIEGTKIGREYFYTESEIREYRRTIQSARGFANPSHPLHGKRGGGGRNATTSKPTPTVDDNPDKHS